MKWLIVSIAMSFLVSASSYADIDLYSPLPQEFSADVSEEIYNRFEAQLGEGKRINDNVDYLIELKNLYCEIIDSNDPNPTYKCSYGRDGNFTGVHAKGIYWAMVKGGFVSDCDSHDGRQDKTNEGHNGTCDVDPVSQLSCIRRIDWLRGIFYSCTVRI